MSALIYIIACYLLTINSIEAARILAVFPVPSISHQVVFRPLTQELAKRGHEVTIITPDPAFQKGAAAANITEIDVHDISYKMWSDNFMSVPTGTNTDLASQMQLIARTLVSIVDIQLKNKEVQNIIQDKTKKFDLILLEACVRPALVYSEIYKVPVIQVSSFGAMIDNYATIGAPIHPFLYPALTSQKLNNLTIWDKITGLYTQYLIDKASEDVKELEHSTLKKHVENNLPSIDELLNNVDMLFLNVFPIFVGIRPVPPTVIFMGGLHQMAEKELPADLKSYLDSSKHGVIYISFGTNVDPSLLPSKKLNTILRTLSKLPYDVLFKWNKDELPGRSANIRISKWLPQSDLLKHPKVKLFVTQGGLQSTDEAIKAGVPLIGMPMLVDQWFMVEKYEYHRIGVRLDMETLTEEKFTNTINTIIEDDSYRRNIIKLRELIQDEPEKPLDRAVWWTEYVLRHGGAKHLRSPVANITWAKYLELELVATVLAVILLLTLALVLALRFLYNIFIKKYCLSFKIKSA